MRSIRLLGSHTDRKPIAEIAIGDVVVLTPPANASTNCVLSEVGVVIDRIELVAGTIKFVFHHAFTGCLFERKMQPTLPGSKAKRHVNVLKPTVVEAEALIARLNRADSRLEFGQRFGRNGYFNDVENVGVVLVGENEWVLVKDNVPLARVDSPTEVGNLFNGGGFVATKRQDENYWFEYSPEAYENKAA